MATLAEHATPKPTETLPARSEVSLFGVPIGYAWYWIEEDEHVLRSSEVDIVVSDPDEVEALRKLGESLEDWAAWIAEEDDDQVTVDELRLALTILTRFRAAYQAHIDHEQQEARRRTLINIFTGRRRRAMRGSTYGSSSRAPKSSAASPA
jgi:hypothetical protein